MKKASIMGAIVGDTIGSIYEFDSIKDYDFLILDERMEFTDDSIMTIAVADWILNSQTLSHSDLAKYMRYWGNKYRFPMGGYGGTFTTWLYREEMGAYNSWGNGNNSWDKQNSIWIFRIHCRSIYKCDSRDNTSGYNCSDYCYDNREA